MHRRYATAALAVCLATAGCGGDDGPKVGPLPSGAPAGPEAVSPVAKKAGPKAASLKGVPAPGALQP